MSTNKLLYKYNLCIILFLACSNYKAYKVPDPPTAGSCDGLVQTCEATIIPADKLRGRTWFITNIRPNFGTQLLLLNLYLGA